MNRSVNRMRPVQQRGCVRGAAGGDPAAVPLTETRQELRPLALAMAYVPVQSWGETYPLCRALDRGTLFPPLDLPFGEVRCG